MIYPAEMLYFNLASYTKNVNTILLQNLPGKAPFQHIEFRLNHVLD